VSEGTGLEQALSSSKQTRIYEDTCLLWGDSEGKKRSLSY
jgi:hypothetical protein